MNLFKKTANIFIFCLIVLPLSGCITGEYLISQEIKAKDEKIETAKINKERKVQGLAPIEDTSDRNIPPASDLNPIALLYVDRPDGEPIEILNVGNINGVDNAGTAPTFALDKSYFITKIWTYHWNYSKGSAQGTVGLRDATGKTFGPWPVTAEVGQDAAPNVNWTVTPNMTLAPGKYTIIDSDPATWSQNSDSQGQGFTQVWGIPGK